VGNRLYRIQKRLSGQPDSNLTWANVFVNSNFPKFQREFLPEFSRQRIVLVANRDVKQSEIAFPVEAFFSVGSDAWLHDLDLIERLKTEIRSRKMTGYLFLFAAGPWANLAVHALWQFQPLNSYIDMGSCLNPFLGLPLDREYLRGGETIHRTCVWETPPFTLRQLGSKLLHGYLKPCFRNR
jgi:hypothetical protein